MKTAVMRIHGERSKKNVIDREREKGGGKKGKRTERRRVNRLCIVMNINMHKKRREKILRELRVVQWQVPIPLLQTRKRDAIYSERFVGRVIPFVPHSDAQEDQVEHVSDTIEWQAERFFPDGVEPVVLHYACAHCCRSRRRGSRSRSGCRSARARSRARTWGGDGGESTRRAGRDAVGGVDGHGGTGDIG